jgi:adenosylcobinamide-GDP ribazoletransferase
VRRLAAAFMLALEFLTVIRARTSGDYGPATIGAALYWFPVIGGLIGGALVAVDLVAATIFAPPVVVVLVLIANALLTGALHLDGLADTADGVFGGRTPESRLEIMRDSRVGSFGVVAVTLVVLLQYAALTSVSDPVRRTALLVAPVLSRAAVVGAIAVLPYARPTGLGRAFKERVSWYAVSVATTIALAVSIVFFGGSGMVAVICAAGVVWLMGSFFRRRLGGLTGDTYGAIVVITETIVFALATVAPDRHWPRW